MPAIQVKSEDLHTLSSQVTAGSNSIQDQLSTLKSHVSAVAASWQGAAHQQFELLYQEWDKSAAGLQDALHGIATLLNTAGTNYQTTENDIRSTFQA